MAKKKSAKSRGQKKTPSKRRAGEGARAMPSSRGGRRETAGAKTPAGKARRKSSKNPPRRGKRGASGKGKAGGRAARKTTGRSRGARTPARKRSPARQRPSRAGGT